MTDNLCIPYPCRAQMQYQQRSQAICHRAHQVTSILVPEWRHVLNTASFCKCCLKQTPQIIKNHGEWNCIGTGNIQSTLLWTIKLLLTELYTVPAPLMYGNPDSRIKEICACWSGIFFPCGIQTPGFWNQDYSSRNPEFF